LIRYLFEQTGKEIIDMMFYNYRITGPRPSAPAQITHQPPAVIGRWRSQIADVCRFLTIASLLCAAPRSLHAQGALIPSGPPAPSMKTLAQIEPRTPISSAPFIITQPGSYYLTTNLTVSSGDAIQINANQVTLDLNGFGIYSTAPVATNTGILLASSRTNITISNGYIVGKVRQTGGVFSGGGFDSGIFCIVDINETNTFGLPVNVRVSGVSVSGCMTYGIGLGPFNTIVESCTIHTVGTAGISASIVRNSTAMNCGTGIAGSRISDCRGESVNEGTGISANETAQNCHGASATGTGLNATKSAINCTGSTGGTEYGLYTEVAQNCSGTSTKGTGLRASSSAVNCNAYGFMTGVYVDYNAQNCNGRASTNGTGLLCYRTASNCTGYTSAGTGGNGLFATTANNCQGQHDGSGVGLYASVAIGCEGRCYGNNYGLFANIANSCTYYRATGTPGIAFGSKYNMP
jgi:hypothetical protein